MKEEKRQESREGGPIKILDECVSWRASVCVCVCVCLCVCERETERQREKREAQQEHIVCVDECECLLCTYVSVCWVERHLERVDVCEMCVPYTRICGCMCM